MSAIVSSRNPATRYMVAALIAAGLQTAVLGYIIESRAAILRSGAEVVLKTAPVDPRDFLRGDYVVLNYDISSVPVSSVKGGLPSAAGEQVLWVRLKPQADGFWNVAESSFSALPEEGGSVVIRSQPFYSYGPAGGDSMRLEYGIERYYVPEGEGKPLEEARQDGQVSVAARVSADGTAQIRSLLVDGKAAYEEPLY
ncbi:GDYXXLXY domain-containing protein [Rhizobium sp. BE258]|uniref:GDYXXLXY domain-containing protein n=1 Tax=Rhizobium sp. BE258 TaxID=2817722 RepID=UPI002857FF5B|nr:GDYXXLXY domain-containing protein [Rhizobium sp. BE258]MDR7146939.1 putative membrane-anchored protein [Rhizobium sp. BE258]